MELTWEHTEEDWTERTFEVQTHDGQVVATFDKQPTLDELREIERDNGERLDLWQSGLVCSNCRSTINDRFASSPGGDIICWECAIDSNPNDENGLVVNTDPTKAVISESKLHEKSLCDYVINVATGCRHGCKFCYVPTTPAIDSRSDMLLEQAAVEDPQKDWGSYLLYRDDLPERLRRELENRDIPSDWKRTERGRGVVMLSSGTDCYQDRRAAQITRGCVHELVSNDIPVRILTRSPAVLRDKDLFKMAGDRITVGSSIPSFDTELVNAIEPGAPPPMARWKALNELHRAGIPVYVSFSPTYPLTSKYQIDNLLGHFRALGEDTVVFHEPINPRGRNFSMLKNAVQELNRPALVSKFEELRDEENWVEYAINQIDLVQRRAKKMYPELKVHSWPDRLLVQKTSGAISNQLENMRKAVSPESFDGNPTEESSDQTTLFDSQSERVELV